MRTVIATVGTTGDIRPFVALAARLAPDHDVMAISWELYHSSFDAAGVSFARAGPTTSGDDIRRTAERASAARSPMEQVAILRDFHLRGAVDHYRRLVELFDGADVVVLHGIHSLAEAAARDAGVPWATAVFDPVLLPSRMRPPPGMPSLGPLIGLEWRLVDHMLRRQDPPLTAALREAGSPSAGKITIFRALSERLHLVACSPLLMRVPPDLPPHVRVTGAWIPRAPIEQLDERLTGFLDAGPAPVVVTFGSMAVAERQRLRQAVLTAVRKVGARALIQADGAGLRPQAAGAEDIRFIGAVEHASLFPRAAVVLHHGGAGTTHAAARAGVPSVVVPHVGDQPYWADRLHRLGVAPKPIPLTRLTADALAHRLAHVLTDEPMRTRARELGIALRSEDGVGTAIGLIGESFA